ncbi:MAG TPA: ABC-type transport auxiliary lipoprotein family protein [Polyangiaceae bacterium]|nr:ABC-type transport auxiliary lipoprotein family protein [Polyangiaceae bacterium]
MRSLHALLLGLAMQGCALFTKADPLDPTYYTPEPFAASPSTATPPPDLALRLGPVTSGSEIRQNLVVRTEGDELSFSEEQRWTEKPEAYLRRALSQELFERRGVRRIVSGPSLAIEVELVAFEEVVRGDGHFARVVATLILHDERVVREERTMTAEVPIANATKAQHSPDTVRALSSALERVVSDIADDVCRPKERAESVATGVGLQ